MAANKSNVGEAIKYELTLSAKVPGKESYSIAQADLKVFITENENFDDVLDSAKEKLEESLAATLLVTNQYSLKR